MTALNTLMCVFVILLVLVAVPWMVLDMWEQVSEWRSKRRKRK